MTKKGRPAGSRNRSWPIAQELPARCPTCGGTEREVLRITASHQIAGSTPDGQPYDRVVWRNVRCRCGQYYRVRSYEFNGNPVIFPEADEKQPPPSG